MYNLHDLLFLGPHFSPVILRAAAALAFWVLAESLFKNRTQVAEGKYFFIKKPGMILANVAWLFCGAMALTFAIGWQIQIAALLGFLTGIKGWFLTKRYAYAFPHGRLAYFLLALVCLALIITGAGAFAIDSPL